MIRTTTRIFSSRGGRKERRRRRRGEAKRERGVREKQLACRAWGFPLLLPSGEGKLGFYSIAVTDCCTHGVPLNHSGKDLDLSLPFPKARCSSMGPVPRRRSDQIGKDGPPVESGSDGPLKSTEPYQETRCALIASLLATAARRTSQGFPAERSFSRPSLETLLFVRRHQTRRAHPTNDSSPSLYARCRL